MPEQSRNFMQEQISALQKVIDKVIEYAVAYSFQALGAIIVLIVGVLIANWAGRSVAAAFKQRNFDPTLSKFLAAGLRILIIAFAVIIALGNFGITIAPFIAVFGGLAFGTSFALQGPLSNYGAGLSIILARPFIVGDTITVAGVSGVVQDVKLAATVVATGDNVIITIPNKHIVGEILHNSKALRVAEGEVGVPYDGDVAAAIDVVKKAILSNPQVSRDSAPQVGIEAFSDSSVTISYRYWVPTLEFYAVTYAVNLSVLNAINAAGINIPFPQREVRILGSAAGVPNGFK